MNTKLVSSIDAVTRSRLETISVGATLVDASKLLSNTQIGLVVVCNAAGAMVGVVTKTDIVRQIGRCLGSACTTVTGEVMSRDVASCRPSDCLPDVLSLMHARGFVHIPVVDEHSKPLGVVNARDALRALLAHETYMGSLLRDYVMGVGYQ